MPTCFVIGCHSGSGHGHRTYRMVPFPKDEKLRQAWIDIINRKNVQLTENSRVCVRHFKVRDTYLWC